MTHNKRFFVRGVAVILIAASLPGCLPLSPTTIISLVVDGISFMASGKTIADHAISEIAQQDCSVGRAILTGADVCFETEVPVATASGDDIDLLVMAF